MNILIAPNSMKGTLNAFDFADTVEAALNASGFSFNLRKLPVADGGDFTGEVLCRAIEANPVSLKVKGPLGHPVLATFWISGTIAIIEMAEASGMKKVDVSLLNPLKATSFGTGQLIAEAIQIGCTEIWLALGGSATVDGGMGVLEALGFKFFDAKGREIPGNGENLSQVHQIQPDRITENLTIKILCDVDNPILGKQGAARVFGPQKGATPEMVEVLEKGLKNWCRLLNKIGRKNISDIPGTGAAGGIAAPLLVFSNARIFNGAAFLLEKLRYEKHLAWADLIITGEGKIDGQTTGMKAPFVVAKRASKYKKPVIAIAGTAEKISPNPFHKIITLVSENVSLKDAMENTKNEVYKEVLLLAGELPNILGS